MSLDDLFSRIEEGTTELNLVVKADVQGSIEALRDAFDKMDQSEVKINIIHSAVGGVTETDVTLAAASDAIIIGFNVRPTAGARKAAEHEKVDIRLYRVIYQAIEDINAARVGMLAPEIVERDTGSAEVRDVFRVPKVGNIAGCYITEGEIRITTRFAWFATRRSSSRARFPRCVASKTTSRPSSRATSAASASTATRTSRSATSSKASASKRSSAPNNASGALPAVQASGSLQGVGRLAYRDGAHGILCAPGGPCWRESSRRVSRVGFST